MTGLGGPSIIAAYERVLKPDGSQRALAKELLEHHELLEGIEIAAAALDETDPDDAAALRDTTAPFSTWPIERRDELRRAGLAALEAHETVSFVHRVGEWRIEHLGHGVLLVQGPRQNFCDPDGTP